MTPRVSHGWMLGLMLMVELLSGASSARPSASTLTNSRKVAPVFELRDSQDRRIRLTDYRGKVVLLDVWATWCTGCKVEMPWFMEFQTKYAKHGLRSVGVAMDEEGWATVKPYLTEHPINYPIVTSDAAFIKAFAVTAMPISVLIDRKGRVADWHVGVVTKDEWEAEIQALLREK